MTKTTKTALEMSLDRGDEIATCADIGRMHFNHMLEILTLGNEAFTKACNVALTGKAGAEDDAPELSPELRARAKALATKYAVTFELEMVEYETPLSFPLHGNPHFMERFAELAEVFGFGDTYVHFVSKALLNSFSRLMALAYQLSFLSTGYIEDLPSCDRVEFHISLRLDLLDALYDCMQLMRLDAIARGEVD